jgi:hypothetical protein
MSAISRGSRRARRPGPVGQDRTAVVGAFGVPSVACDREEAGTEGPVLADFVEKVGELAVSERIGIRRA